MRSELRLTCPLCGVFYATVKIDGNVTRRVRNDVRELILASHVRDYHPVVNATKSKRAEITSQ